jgi:hypothetical protein
MTVVQVFLVGDTGAELSEELMSIRYEDRFTYVVVRNDEGLVWEVAFSNPQIRMIRFYEETEEGNS